MTKRLSNDTPEALEADCSLEPTTQEEKLIEPNQAIEEAVATTHSEETETKNEPEKEENLKEILDFAVRDVVKTDTLTDDMVCSMIADLRLEIWVASTCNVFFYQASVSFLKLEISLKILPLGLERQCEKQGRSVVKKLTRGSTNKVWRQTENQKPFTPNKQYTERQINKIILGHFFGILV